MKKLLRLPCGWHMLLLVLATGLLALITNKDAFLQNAASLLVVCDVSQSCCSYPDSNTQLHVLQRAALSNPVQGYYKLGLFFKARGDTAAAVEALAQSRSPLSFFLLGRLHSDGGDVDSAIRDWNRAGAASYFSTQGTDYFAAGDLVRALEYLELAARVDPVELTWYHYRLLAELYLRDHRIGEAEAAWHKAYEGTHAADFVQMYLLGSIKREQREFQQADSLLQDAVQLYQSPAGDRARASLCVDIGNWYRDHSEPVRAEIWYARAETISPDITVTVLLARSVNLRYQQLYATATRVLEKAVFLAPSNARAHYYLAASYSWQCFYERSAIALTQAISLEPDNGLYRYDRSRIASELGRWKEAELEADLALSLGDSLEWQSQSLVTLCN